MAWPDLLELKRRLQEIIEEDEDDVRFYPLPTAMKVMVLGRGDAVPDRVDVFLE